MTRRPFALGLTGSIGMGKSTALEIFATEGIPTWSADEAVQRIYSPGGGGAAALAELVPEAVSSMDGAVRKDVLKALVDGRPDLLAEIENVVHPLVRRDREAFFSRCADGGADLAVAEVPLLFESRAETEFDAVAAVTAPEALQKQRVLARDGMTPRRYHSLRARQLSDGEKCERADHIIRSTSMARARSDVMEIIAKVRGAGIDRDRA